MPEVRTYRELLDATDTLADLPAVRDVGYRGPLDGLDVVLIRGVDRVPPSVLRNIADADLGIRRVDREGERLRVVCG